MELLLKLDTMLLTLDWPGDLAPREGRGPRM